MSFGFTRRGLLKGAAAAAALNLLKSGPMELIGDAYAADAA